MAAIKQPIRVQGSIPTTAASVLPFLFPLVKALPDHIKERKEVQRGLFTMTIHPFTISNDYTQRQRWRKLADLFIFYYFHIALTSGQFSETLGLDELCTLTALISHRPPGNQPAKSTRSEEIWI